MNQETWKLRELRFVCPECGANSLCAEASGYLDIDHVYDNGVFTWGDMRPEEIWEYHCRECGHVLEFDEDEGIVEWLIAHCKQDESEAGQAQGDNSRVPPASES